MGLGITEILVAILGVLFGGAVLRGNIHKKTAEKQAERAEKAEIENVMAHEENRRLTAIHEIKEKGYVKEREIENSDHSVERVPLGTNGVHDGTAGSGSSDL